MTPQILGLHHVTAIVGDPQENVDFYAGLLGLRLVKTTVNFDDPHTYHFYFGDGQGRPGTLITFFPWPSGRRGARGVSQVSAFAFTIPAQSLGYWQERLAAAGVRYGGPEERFGSPTLSFYDPAGLLVELVAEEDAAGEPWRAGPIPAEHAIRRIAGVTLTVPQHAPTAELLTEAMGFRHVGAQFLRQRAVVLGTGADLFAVRGDFALDTRRAHAPISSRPISIRRSSLVPAPMSSSWASR